MSDTRLRHDRAPYPKVLNDWLAAAPVDSAHEQLQRVRLLLQKWNDGDLSIGKYFGEMTDLLESQPAPACFHLNRVVSGGVESCQDCGLIRA